MKKNKLIPFGLLPAAWGLKGKSRDIAEAEYYLTGYELEEELICINYENKKERDLQLLMLDKKHGRITENEYNRTYADCFLEGEEREIGLLEADRAENKINDLEYEKRLATIEGKSWIKIIHVDSEGSFEFDWNTKFIEELEEAGFGPAPKEEMIVDEWFNEICKNITIEQYQGDIALLEEQVEERKNNFVEETKVAPGKRVVK